MMLKRKVKTLFFILSGILICVVIFTACDFKTYHLIKPGKPSDTFDLFYRAVSDGDDTAANDLLYNYSWRSNLPQIGEAENEYSVNGITLSGTDAMVLRCLMESRSYKIVSESDYAADDHRSSVTIQFTSFSLSKYQAEITSRSIAEVTDKQYHGGVFKDENDTKEIIEKYKTDLLKDPKRFYTTDKYKIDLINVSGKWKVILTEDFYQALSGFPS